ncbi:helix-turn-helix transcriptional regulator [Nocardioides marmoraquaticus]
MTQDPNADSRADIRDFLATRRARLTPADVGLPAGNRRRVPGLRREEVAVLAGVSTEWYTRLEKGHITGVSEDVLDAVATALRLSDAEHAYLFDLARAARPKRTAAKRQTTVPEPVRWMIDSMHGSAAIVCNGRLDLMAVNPLGRALYSPIYDGQPDNANPNIARYQFLDPSADAYYPDWAGAADVTAAILRTEAGRVPDDRRLRTLVGELSTISEEFRTRWVSHDVRLHHAGAKTFHHPAVGPMELNYHTMDVSTRRDRSLVVTVYTPEPSTDSEERFALLASWAATAGAVLASGKGEAHSRG